MKIKLFTHTDLDGVGCAILAKRAYEDVEVAYCNYGEIDATVSEFIDSGEHEKYDYVIITDISVSEEVARKIENTIAHKIQLLDHHATAKGLNQYEWAYVADIIDGVRTSGTSLLFEYLRDDYQMEDVSWLAEKVRRYDTWEWNTKYNDTEAKQLNDLLYILGRERFVERFVNDPNPAFTETERLLLNLEQERIDAYVARKTKEVVIRKIGEYMVGVVFAEQFISQLGHAIAQEFEDIDFVAIVNTPKAVSLRTAKDIDLSQIAKRYGGGGHPKAAGIPMKGESVLEFIDKLFGKGVEG